MLLTKKQETSWNCGAWTAPCFNSLRIPAPASAWEFSQLTSCTSRLSTVTPGTSLISEKIHAYLCKTLNSKKNTNVSRNFKIMVQAGIIRINSPIGLCILCFECGWWKCCSPRASDEKIHKRQVEALVCEQHLASIACDLQPRFRLVIFHKSRRAPFGSVQWRLLTEKNGEIHGYLLTFRKDTCLPM